MRHLSFRARVVGLLLTMTGFLTPIQPPPEPTVIRFNEQPFAKRLYAKAVAGGLGVVSFLSSCMSALYRAVDRTLAFQNPALLRAGILDLAALQTKAGELRDQLMATLGKAVEENRGLTDEEQTEYDERHEELNGQLKLIAQAQALAALNQRIEAPVVVPEGPDIGGAGGDGDGDLGGDGDQQRADSAIWVGTPREWQQSFRSLGEQLLAVRAAAEPGAAELHPRLMGIHHEFRAATGLGESVPSDGGFLVQKDFIPGILERTHQEGSLLSRVDNLPVGAGSNGIKINAVKETSRVDGSRMGGIRGYWAAEAAEKTASQPEFRQMELNLHKVIGLCYATDELLEDAVALGAWIEKHLPIELRFKVENAIINGTGAGQPVGILAGGSLVSVAKETGQLAATIVYENIVKMYARHYSTLVTYVGEPASYPKVWLINQDTIPQLFTMGLTVGVGGAPVFVPANGAAGQPYNMLLGLPILPVEYMATLGTVGDIVLADLSEYQMIEKGGIKSDFSIHVRFIYDESVFRFVYRVDGQPKWNSALTPFSGTNTVSPFVALAARA